MVELLIKDLKSANEGNIIDEIKIDSKINEAKLSTDFWAKLSKSKNKIKLNFLDESKLLAKPNSKLGFLTSKAKLVFA